MPQDSAVFFRVVLTLPRSTNTGVIVSTGQPCVVSKLWKALLSHKLYITGMGCRAVGLQKQHTASRGSDSESGTNATGRWRSLSTYGVLRSRLLYISPSLGRPAPFKASQFCDICAHHVLYAVIVSRMQASFCSPPLIRTAIFRPWRTFCLRSE